MKYRSHFWDSSAQYLFNALSRDKLSGLHRPYMHRGWPGGFQTISDHIIYYTVQTDNKYLGKWCINSTKLIKSCKDSRLVQTFNSIMSSTFRQKKYHKIRVGFPQHSLALSSRVITSVSDNRELSPLVTRQGTFKSTALHSQLEPFKHGKTTRNIWRFAEIDKVYERRLYPASKFASIYCPWGTAACPKHKVTLMRFVIILGLYFAYKTL